MFSGSKTGGLLRKCVLQHMKNPAIGKIAVECLNFLVLVRVLPKFLSDPGVSRSLVLECTASLPI
jgi:hypothetical protein